MIENIEKGDWVRFRNNGVLVIGLVQYVETGRWTKIHTDISETTLASILEVRKANANNRLRDKISEAIELEGNDGYSS